MRVRYIYSACVVIDTPDVSILCDPWFTQGIYDGAWYQWPVVEHPLDVIGPVDLIYISHIHPDHYDPAFLKTYIARYPAARIVIGPQSPPILEQKMRMDGLAFEVLEDRTIGATRLAILPNHARTVNIDTALVVVRDGQSVANLNDNPFDLEQIAAISALSAGTEILALLSYGGATGHPHTYMFDDRAGMEEAIRFKERHFLDLFHRFIAALNPRVVIPFAGKYWLGGPLAALNDDRGIPDPVIAARETDGRAVVLADGGQGVFDLDNMSASDLRTAPYDHAAVQRHFASLDFSGYAYEREIRPDPGHSLPLLPLLNAALRRAREKFKITEPCWVCIRPSGHDHFLYFDAAGTDDAQIWKKTEPPVHLLPRIEIHIDDRYLFGLLTRLYHWNNASLGSHYLFRRVPDVFRRDVFSFLDFLQV